MFGSLHIRLTILCIALAILPLGLVGTILAWQNYQLQQRYVLDYEHQVAQRASLQVADFVTTTVDKLSLVIETSSLQNPNSDSSALSVSKVMLATNAFDELALLNPQGQEQARIGRTTIFTAADFRDRSHEEAIIQALQTDLPYYSTICLNPISNEPVIAIAVPLVNLRTGQISGLVSGDVRLKPIGDVVANIDFGKQGTITITDATGRVIAHRDPSVVLRGTIINNLEAEGVYPGITGGEVVRTVVPFTIGKRTLYTIAELPVSEAQATAYRTILTTSVLLIATLVIAAGIGFLTIRQIVRPIQHLATTAREISAGDLTRHAVVTGRDELADLATAFNSMTAQLRQLLTGLEQRVADRTAALEEALEEVRTRAIEQERLLEENSRQRAIILDLSVPVLPISTHTLVMPLVGDLDSARLQLVQEQALRALERSSAAHLVIDVTGVPVVDTHVAQGILVVVQAARLLGVQVILVGIRPEVAQTIVSLGIDLRSIQTSSNLQRALNHIRFN